MKSDDSEDKDATKIDEDKAILAEECVESGGIYSSIAEGCYYNGEDNNSSNDDDSKITDDPKVQKCIDEGGVYSSILEECFK